MKASIIGGGIAGLTVALGLQQKGIEFDLYEAASEFKMAGAGIILSPNALYVFDRLGLHERLKDLGHPLPSFDVTDGLGSIIQKNGTEFRQHGKDYCSLGIHRAILQDLLLEKIDHKKLHLNRALKRVDQSISALHFSNGEVVNGDLILGCDGIHSVVRQSIFPQTDLRYSGQTCWRGVVDNDMMGLPDPAEMWGNGVRFGFVPIGNKKVYWYATAVRPAGQKDQVPAQLRQELNGLFQTFSPFVNELIQGTERIMRHDLFDIKPLETWHKQNMILVGDAAHAMTPNMGQGAAQSIEDAWSLVHHLSEHNHFEDAFVAFEKDRLQKATTVSTLSWRIGQITNPQNRVVCWMRNTLLKFAPSSAAEKQKAQLFSVPSYL